MKISDPDTPVRLEWLLNEGARLDARPYVAGSYAAKDLLGKLSVPKQPLHELTTGHDGGIYNGPQFRRVYVTDPDYGVPFMGSADMLEWDLSRLPLLSKSDAHSSRLSYLRVEPGMTLISCSGTVGRVMYARGAMGDTWSSQDMIKVVPDPDRVHSGYINAFLSSNYGVPILTGSRFGTGIRHLEPGHVANIPVPRFGDEVEGRIHELVEEAAALRTDFQRKIVAATEDLFTSAGLPELIDPHWHRQGRDLGFSAQSGEIRTLRALNYGPRAHCLMEKLRSGPYRTLGEICQYGLLSRGKRFKRVDTDPGFGYRLIGQRQAFWLRPEGRWVALNPVESQEVKAVDETVLVAARGTLGENEVYGRAVFATGTWLDFAFSEDFLRVVSGDPEFPGAYLFAFLRSEAVFRIFRSMSAGGKQQDIHDALRRELPVPECPQVDRARIAETVRDAYRARDTADSKEDQALALLDEVVRGAR